MKRPDPLTVAEEREVARLKGRGKSDFAARQYVYENRFRGRSRDRSPGAATPGASEALNSKVQNSLHADQCRTESQPCPSIGRSR